jgi:hypothetical protein
MGHTVAGATPTVVPAAAVACPTSAVAVAISTTSCTASDDALLKWTLAKRKLIVQKFCHPNNTAPAHAALFSDMSHAGSSPHAPTNVPTVEECIDEYDDTEISVHFSSVEFTSSLVPRP